MANSIILRADVSKLQKEFEASESITPGMLVERTSAGKIQKHSTAGGNVQPMFLKENALQGEDIDDALASGDKCQVWYPGSGDEVYAILADGESVSEGDYLESDGNGYLQKHVSDTASSAEAFTAYSKQIVGIALHNLDLTSSSGGESSNITYEGSNARIKVEVV
jgi:hypothetical protein